MVIVLQSRTLNSHGSFFYLRLVQISDSLCLCDIVMRLKEFFKWVLGVGCKGADYTKMERRKSRRKNKRGVLRSFRSLLTALNGMF